MRRDGGGPGGSLSGGSGLGGSGDGGDRHEELLRRYLEEIASFPALSVDEESALARSARDGDRSAGEQLVRSNLKLVVAVARRYAATGVPLLDLVQEGNLGLMGAVDAFDPDRGFSFRTFAMWWIRRAITEGIAAAGGSVGFHARTEAEQLENRLQDVWDAFVASSGRQPTLAELASRAGVTEARVAEILASAPPPDTEGEGEDETPT